MCNVRLCYTFVLSEYVYLFTFSGKAITKCCLSQHSGHFYIGTEGGNLYTLDVKLFKLDSEVVYWNNATTL